MAVFIPKLLATKTPISLLLTITVFSLFLVNKVKSDFSFNFPRFGQDVVKVIGFANDATLSNGVIQLTKKDKRGNALPHSAGQSGWFKPIRIYHKNSGKVADFVTEFSFVVNRNGNPNYGDRFVFFFASTEFSIPDPKQSDGGFLGIFTSQTAFNPSNNPQILLVEFDSFANDWDPNPDTQFPHLGIDVGSIKSVSIGTWVTQVEPDGAVAHARIDYSSLAKRLTVTVSYDAPLNATTILIHDIDLTTVLPEQVQIGFSAATGDLAETHDILSWSFTSNL